MALPLSKIEALETAGHRFCARTRTKLAENRLDVELHRVRRNVEAAGNFLVAQSFGHRTDDLDLAGREQAAKIGLRHGIEARFGNTDAETGCNGAQRSIDLRGIGIGGQHACEVSVATAKRNDWQREVRIALVRQQYVGFRRGLHKTMAGFRNDGAKPIAAR
jgi:hypothetical protein